MAGLLAVLTGTSGAGKDTVLAHLKKLGRPYFFAITATTRPPRGDERQGLDYCFLTEGEFEHMVQAGEMLENAWVYGYRYGVPRGPIREALIEGKDVLLRTDIQGARHIRSVAPGAITIFVAPPSIEEQKRRLEERAADTSEQQELRLRVAAEELASAEECDYFVVNDDVGRCASEIEEILATERRRTDRTPVRV